MKLATFSIPSPFHEEWLRLFSLVGASHILFGDVALLHGPDSAWGLVVGLAQRLGIALKEYPDSVAENHLFLVVQVSDLFQLHNPHVPVIVDKGRHMSVLLSPGEAREIIGKRECCYTLFPLFGTQEIIKILVPPALPGTPQEEIQTLVRAISTSNLRNDIDRLVRFRTRFAFDPQYNAAAAMVERELRLMGYATRLQEVLVPPDRTLNVIADKTGRMPGPHDLILVTAHLDSINEADLQDAPGADDNASGCAGALEIARLLSQQTHQHDLRFIFFGGEERGLYGSKKYVKSDIAELPRTRAVINMDMIGVVNRPSDPPAVLIESASTALANRLAWAASLYSPGLTVEWSGKYANSDHVPFIDASIVAALTIEASGNMANNSVHSKNDLPAILRLDLMEAILGMNLAFVAEAVGLMQPLHPTRLLEQKGMATMSETVRPDEGADGAAAVEKIDARDVEDKLALLRSKDHLPPITLIDGSFVLTIRSELGAVTATGDQARPHKYPTTLPFKRMKIIDGNGVIRFVNNHAEGIVLNIWLRRFLPAVEPQIRLARGHNGNVEIETDELLSLDPRGNPVHSTRRNVYQHPANDYDIFFQHILVTEGDDVLFEADAAGHPQGYEVWIWHLPPDS